MADTKLRVLELYSEQDVHLWLESVGGPIDTIFYYSQGVYVLATRDPRVKELLSKLDQQLQQLEHHYDLRPDRQEIEYYTWKGWTSWLAQCGLEVYVLKKQ